MKSDRFLSSFKRAIAECKLMAAEEKSGMLDRDKHFYRGVAAAVDTMENFLIREKAALEIRAISSPGFEELKATCRRAKQVWEAQFDQDCKRAEDSPEWHRYMLLMDEVIEFRCNTLEELKEKCAFILSDTDVFDTVHSAHRAEDGRKINGLTMFLQSIVDTPVDKLNTGDKT